MLNILIGKVPKILCRVPLMARGSLVCHPWYRLWYPMTCSKTCIEGIEHDETSPVRKGAQGMNADDWKRVISSIFNNITQIAACEYRENRTKASPLSHFLRQVEEVL
ncbi:hypothetical protein TNCV_882721 [Trichonephila clavipes]|nr:hypothetical protein TNCV_882721 [Trichonephila clavipes]